MAEMSPDHWPRVAVIGCGYWGKNLVRNFAELGVLAGLVDHRPELTRSLSERHGGAAMDFEEVLANPQIEALAVVTPGPSHFELARQGLEAGKHVYVEKPLAMSSGEVRILDDLATRQQRTLMGGHILRYHSAFEALSAMTETGAIGPVRHIVSERLNLGKILIDEDVIWSLAPHDLSMILAVMKTEPDAVICHGDAFLRTGVSDMATLRLVFSGHRSAQVRLSWMSPVKQHRLTVTGEAGVIVFDDTRGWSEKLTLHRPALDWDDAAVQPAPGQPQAVMVAESEPLKAECRHFLNATRSGATPLTDGKESHAVISVIERAQASLQANGAAR